MMFFLFPGISIYSLEKCTVCFLKKPIIYNLYLYLKSNCTLSMRLTDKPEVNGDMIKVLRFNTFSLFQVFGHRLWKEPRHKILSLLFLFGQLFGSFDNNILQVAGVFLQHGDQMVHQFTALRLDDFQASLTFT